MKNYSFFFLILYLFFCNFSFSQEWTSERLYYPTLVDNFYKAKQMQPGFTSFDTALNIKKRFVEVIDSAIYSGLDKDKYHYGALKNSTNSTDSLFAAKASTIFIDAVIAYCKDIYQGADISKRLDNDEISAKYADADDTYILDKLAGIKSLEDFNIFLASLEPKGATYTILKDELVKQLAAGNTKTVEQLNTTMNFYRWIHHFHFDKFIIVNIPAAMLRYYDNDSMKLEMKAVVGKTSTKTPLLATYCKQVILYPYWNVPTEIGTKELFPRFKKSPGGMDTMNVQLIDDKGAVVDAHSIDWSQYDKNNFPYRFRQATGCNNALGVIKFNLTDPFDIYLHDTNLKSAFRKSDRYLSHGCIRLEKPLDLGNYLLDNKIDESFVHACVVNQKPVANTLEKPVPVFIVYMTADVVGNSVIFYKDIYRIF